MSFEDDSLDSLKAIVRTAFKYNVATGLHPSIPDLERIRKSLLSKNLIQDAEEMDFIISFLKREREHLDEKHRSLLTKTREISESIPIGTMVSFRYCDETLTGELRGYVADRILIIAKFKGNSRLFEVSPLDLKV